MTSPRQTPVARVAEFLGRPLRGEAGSVGALVPFPNPEPASLSFCSAERCEGLAPAAAGAVVLALPTAADDLLAAGYAVIESDHPKYDLARVHAALFAPDEGPGVHPSAVVGEGVTLGEGVRIGPGCVLDGPVALGPGCVLGASVRIRGPARLGARVRIGSCAVIGEDAFSYGFGPGGDAVRFPSEGGVAIGDDAEIGPNTFVAAGVFDTTEIGAGAKLADLVSISNAVQIGRNTVVTARVAISGRARIGSECWIGQSAAIRQGCVIGDGALVGMGSVVVKDVPDGVVAMGNPATVRKQR